MYPSHWQHEKRRPKRKAQWKNAWPEYEVNGKNVSIHNEPHLYCKEKVDFRNNKMTEELRNTQFYRQVMYSIRLVCTLALYNYYIIL